MQIVETAIFVNLSKFTAHAGITGVALPAVDCTLLTEWQVSFAFFQPGSAAAALPGATFRFALKETPTGDPLIFNSSLTASGAVYTADISSVDSAALRTLIGDQPSIAVVGEIEWTISSRRERVHFPVTVTNAWARPDDAAPDPVAEASIVWFTEQLATRAVRFDVAQTLTTQQKTQGRDNLGITGTGGSAAWADITGKPSTFPPSAHTHAIADVTGLQTALDEKISAQSVSDNYQSKNAKLTNLLTLASVEATNGTLILNEGQSAQDGGPNGYGGNAGVVNLEGGAAYADSSQSNDGGHAGQIHMIGGNAQYSSAGADAGTINTSASGYWGGGSLNMSSNGANRAGNINTQAGGNLTMGTANVSGPAVAGTLLTDASSLPAANLTGTIANARLPSTITGLTSVTSSAFVGPLTGTASGNLVAGGALGTPSSGELTNCTSIPAGNLTGTVATARLGTGTADATTYLRGDATWAAVSGGLANITETLLTASPNITVNAEQLAVANGTTNVDLVLTPKGTGAFILGPAPDNTATGGNKRGLYAKDFSLVRNAANQVASGQSSVNLGEFCLATGLRSIVSGFNKTASGSNAVGLNGNATGSDSFATSAGTASGQSSAAIGESTASGRGSIALGEQARADRTALFAFSGYLSYWGRAQKTIGIVAGKTTTNSAVVLLALEVTSTRYTIPSGVVFSGTVTILGVKSDGSAVASYIRQVAIKNVAGTTSLVGTVNTIGTDTAAGTSIAITADDTNDALKIEVTGIASETWRWVATIEGVEVAYGA